MVLFPEPEGPAMGQEFALAYGKGNASKSVHTGLTEHIELLYILQFNNVHFNPPFE